MCIPIVLRKTVSIPCETVNLQHFERTHHQLKATPKKNICLTLAELPSPTHNDAYPRPPEAMSRRLSFGELLLYSFELTPLW